MFKTRVGFVVVAVFVAWSIALPHIGNGRSGFARSEEVKEGDLPRVEEDLGSFKEASKTDDAAVAREEEANVTDGFSVKERKMLEEAQERFEFQAEVSRLMDIIINSLYTKKEIFLRELISNASDALDKIRFMSLADHDILGDTTDLEIRVEYDRKASTVTIRDTGIGMTKQDLIQNLGTVAKSGTSAFMEAIAKGGDMSLIGQFGVGFYSVYLVADRVRVVSKHNDDEQHVWESTADATFSVAPDPRGNTLGRGTEVTLFLKEDASEFVGQDRLKDLIRQYSEFITFPIYLKMARQESVEVPIEEEEEAETAATPASEEGEEASEGEEEIAAEEEEASEEEAKPKTKREQREVWEWTKINEQKAIWTRDRSDIEDEEYSKFYKSISKDTEDPLTFTHFKAEGEIDFRSILFVPSKAPYNLWDDYYGKSSSLRLYVRRVLVSSEFEDLVPRWMSFVKGVVDSDDLPLNVSRETLQQHKILRVISKKLVRKTLEMLRVLAQGETAFTGKEEGDEATEAAEPEVEKDEKDKDEKGKEKEHPYATFWEQFGKAIKLGMMESADNRTKLSKLLRFKSSKSNGKWTSLDEYVSRMASTQKNIFYIAGENVEAVEESPFLERFKSKGLEVLYLVDPIDEYAIQQLTTFDDKKLQSITKEGLKFGDESKVEHKRVDAYKEKFEPLTKYLQDVLGDRVEKVVVGQRVESAPSILVTSQYGYSANMERIMRSQAFSDEGRLKYMVSKKTMEINPRHPIVMELNTRVAADSDSADTKDLAFMLYDAALLNSGFQLEEPKEFSLRIFRLMKTGLDLESLDLAPELEVEVEEDEEEEEEEDEEGTVDKGEGEEEAAVEDDSTGEASGGGEGAGEAGDANAADEL